MSINVRTVLATLLIKTPVRIALGLFAAYLLFAWLAFEPLVKWAAPKFIADKSHHQLRIGAAKFHPFALSVDLHDLKLSEPDGKPLLAFDELFVDFDASSLFRWAYTFDEIRLTGPRVNVVLMQDARLNWSALLDAFKSDESPKPNEKPSGLPRLLIHHIALERGHVDLADRTVGFSTKLDPINFTLDELSTLPDNEGNYALAATTALGARIHWKGDVSLKPVVATGDLSIDQVDLTRLWPYMQDYADMAPAEGIGALALSYRVGWADKKLSLNLDKFNLSLDKLALSGKQDKTPAIRLARLAVNDGRFDLAKQSFDVASIELKDGQVDLQRGADGHLQIERWFKPPAAAKPVAPPAEAAEAKPTDKKVAKAAPAPSQPAPQSAGEPWHVNLAAFRLDGLGIKLSDQTFVNPLSAEIGNIKLNFAAKLAAGVGPLQATVENLGLDVGDVQLDSSTTKGSLFSLKNLSVSGGKADLATQTASLDKVRLSGGKLQAERNAQGRINLVDAFKMREQAASEKSASKPTESAGKDQQAAPAWHWQVAEASLSGFEIKGVDAGVQPAGSLTLQAIEASVKGLSDDFKLALPVKLAMRVKEGGHFSLDGKVVPGKPSADLRLKLADLTLAPAQTYLSKFANLTLATGRASVDGRLKYAGHPDFKGGFSVDDLLLNETDGGARFLAWKSLNTDSLMATDKALNLEELKVIDLGAKLIIYKDKTLNLKKILKSAPAESAVSPKDDKTAEAKPVTEPVSVAQTPAGPPAFLVNLERISVAGSAFDFADLSLAFPFGTRIHDFKGHFNGISNRPNTVAQLEFDGQVDEYGLARAVGQVDLFNPTRFMDIKTVFHNVEMTNLTPYSATFAGRKIDSGKLSLDLEYKIKDRQLLGENQVIMDKLTLGERVESPGAMNLPLDLAIAILQDSDGKIDLGLPVSGSLDDPQFSYGRIIWKAITNVIVKIATAPFRALASLFGGDAEKLEKVSFEAGEAALTPPEREKFKTIAKILTKRPGLALKVTPSWNADIDRPVLQERQFRRKVAEHMGIKLAATEDAGPMSTANPKVQAALATLYGESFGKDKWIALQANWQRVNAEKKPEQEGKLMSRLSGLFKKQEEPLSPDVLARLKGADLYAMIDRQLLNKEVVPDSALQALAASRAQAVSAALAVQSAPMQRVQLLTAVMEKGEGRDVPVKLEVAVAKK